MLIERDPEVIIRLMGAGYQTDDVTELRNKINEITNRPGFANVTAVDSKRSHVHVLKRLSTYSISTTDTSHEPACQSFSKTGFGAQFMYLTSHGAVCQLYPFIGDIGLLFVRQVIVGLLLYMVIFTQNNKTKQSF